MALYVTIEDSDCNVISRATIQNNRKGDDVFGQYDCEFVNFGGSHGPEVWRNSEVKNHERGEEPVWVLVMKAIAAAF